MLVSFNPLYETELYVSVTSRLVWTRRVLEDERTRLSAVQLKSFIVSGLKSLHGEVSRNNKKISFKRIKRTNPKPSGGRGAELRRVEVR